MYLFIAETHKNRIKLIMQSLLFHNDCQMVGTGLSERFFRNKILFQAIDNFPFKFAIFRCTLPNLIKRDHRNYIEILQTHQSNEIPQDKILVYPLYMLSLEKDWNEYQDSVQPSVPKSVLCNGVLTWYRPGGPTNGNKILENTFWIGGNDNYL